MIKKLNRLFLYLLIVFLFLENNCASIENAEIKNLENIVALSIKEKSFSRIMELLHEVPNIKQVVDSVFKSENKFLHGELLFQAVFRNIELTSEVIKYNFDWDDKDKVGATIIHWAAKYANPEKTKLFLETRLEINSQVSNIFTFSSCPWGGLWTGLDTALHIACRDGKKENIFFLLSFGANLKLENRWKEKAFSIIKDEKLRTEILDKILKAKEDYTIALAILPAPLRVLISQYFGSGSYFEFTN